jgi:UDP-N-acetylglucosamine 4,6-dehydratase
MGRSILVTGGTGFFGRHFVRRLLAIHPAMTLTDGRTSQLLSNPAYYSRICIYSRDEHKQAQMREEFANDKRLRFFIGDVRDGDRLARAMVGVDDVVHAAALKRIEVGHYNPDEMVKTNVLGTMHVIEACFVAGVGRCVYLSSDKAYQPISAYGHSKALAESLVLAANGMFGEDGPRFAVTRYGNVAGSTGSVIPIWRTSTSTLRITDPDCTRFWMTSDEAVDLVLKALDEMPTRVLVPELPAYRLGDLAAVIAPNRDWRLAGLGEYEKMHESMAEGITSDRARRLTREELQERLRSV